MAEAQQTTPSLAEQWSLQVKELQSNQSDMSVEKSRDIKPADHKPEEVVTVNAVAPADETAPVDVTPVAEETAPVAEETAPAEDTTETPAEEEAGTEEDGEEKPEIKLETAPADFRFPTTNQTRHCFTRYIEYHRCFAAKGEGAPECDRFAKYYRSLCPANGSNAGMSKERVERSLVHFECFFFFFRWFCDASLSSLETTMKDERVAI